MKKQFKLAAGVAALIASMGAQAAIVDLFTTDQNLLSDNTQGFSGLSSNVGIGDATILGGQRELFVNKIDDGGSPGNNSSLRSEIGVFDGILSFSNSASVKGTGIVQWDGSDTGVDANNKPILNATGLGGADLTDLGGSNAFKVDTVFSDLGFEFVIEAYTNATSFTKISFLSSQVNAPTTSYIPFAGFTNPFLCGLLDPTDANNDGVVKIECGAGNSVVDFSNLGALQLIIDPLGGSTSVDLQLDSVTTPVPEPGALALLGGTLLAGGLAGVARRRKS
jgi:hypothetical protein